LRELECSTEFAQRNFTPSSYTNLQNKEQPMYQITRDGFTMLAMGFTGKEAAKFKEKYIATFNMMEEALRSMHAVPRELLTLQAEILKMDETRKGINKKYAETKSRIAEILKTQSLPASLQTSLFLA
jgi:phage regulator Rha-like protein